VSKHITNHNEEKFKPLLLAGLEGDEIAYANFLSELAVFAKLFIQRKLGYQEESEDLVQEILISIHKARHSYDATRSCMPWIAAIMHYRLSDWLRHHYKQPIQVHTPIEELEAFFADDVTDTSNQNEYIEEVLALLSAKQQAVIKAMYYDDMSVVQTSQALGMSISSVKVTAHRAYHAMRLLWKKES
jgi:RNA polymerase sigma-70 factor (ECF subfamily)